LSPNPSSEAILLSDASLYTSSITLLGSKSLKFSTSLKAFFGPKVGISSNGNYSGRK
jgi:hypothetical protein